MVVLGIIFARAGSKGLPDKCVRDLLGRPVIEYTFDHAAASHRLTAVVLTTDSEPLKSLARRRGIEVIDRPAELASDTATIDAAARHAAERWESGHGQTVDVAVLLYGNIPLRAEGLIDRAIERLVSTGADSVRSVALVTKQHPDWVHRLDGDRMSQFRKNGIYRRQDLEPIYYHDGAVAAVTRAALFGALAAPDDHQAFLGADRRALIQRPDDAVDIDEPIDLLLAETLLRARCDSTGQAGWSAQSLGIFPPDDRDPNTGKPVWTPRKGEKFPNSQRTLPRPPHVGPPHAEPGESSPGQRTRECPAGAYVPAQSSDPRNRPMTGAARNPGIAAPPRPAHAGPAHAEPDERSAQSLGIFPPDDRDPNAGKPVWTPRKGEKFPNSQRTLRAAQSNSTVSIGPHRIGPGCRTFVIAEAGVNHDGRVDTARRLVDVAAECGADAVKFQIFRAADLATDAAATADYQLKACGTRSQREMLERLELSDEAFRSLAEYCRERSILFLATPFSIADVRRLTALEVWAIKIASTDLTNTSLLDAAAQTGASIILSTGASTEEEIASSVERLLERVGHERLALLHCVSCYPTPVAAINLQVISTLRHRFGVPCGLSDHTVSTRMGGLAVAAGAALVEKHFTLDRGATGPDHAMSLAPDQLAEYIAGVREAEQARGDGRLGMIDLEREVRAVAAKSVVASVALPAGTRLTAEMLTLKRPGTGLPAAAVPRLVGRRTLVDLPRDAFLSWEVVE